MGKPTLNDISSQTGKMHKNLQEKNICGHGSGEKHARNSTNKSKLNLANEDIKQYMYLPYIPVCNLNTPHDLKISKNYTLTDTT